MGETINQINMRQKKWYQYNRISVKVNKNLSEQYMALTKKEKTTAQDDLNNYINDRVAIDMTCDADNRPRVLNNLKTPALLKKKMRNLIIK